MRWSAGAIIAGWSFILSENRNIAADGAILLHDMEEQAVSVLLTNEQFDRECGYRTALSIITKSVSRFARNTVDTLTTMELSLLFTKRF